MPPSKTAALEKRIEKLEQELAAYKRQLQKSEPGANAGAREARQQLVDLRHTARAFFATAESHGVRFWAFHPDVANAADVLRSIATDPDPNPTKRRTK